MTPSALAAKRATEIAKIPFDTNAYHCITSLEELDRWVARARETGLIAFDTETSSLDANQAELVGLSLALAPGEAAYVPLRIAARRRVVIRECLPCEVLRSEAPASKGDGTGGSGG